MSVPKSKRGISPVEYIENAKRLREITTCYLRRFPTKGVVYSYINDIVNKIEVNCQYANSIYINRNSPKDVILKRVEYLKEAKNGCKVLSSEISRLYEFIKYKGLIENPFKTINDLNRKFIRWQDTCDTQIDLLDNITNLSLEKIRKGEK